MKVLITGASGLVGSALTSHLISSGHEVTGLSRCSGTPIDRVPSWSPPTGEVNARALDGADAIVHLASANIMDRRWSHEFKAEMRASRVDATAALCTHLAHCESVPRIMISASAIGIYGDRGEEILDEQSLIGSSYIAEMARDWEHACKPLVDAGTRVVSLRIGVVLSRKGGALKKMYLPFKMGLGGVIGSGRQYMSWICMDDLLCIIGYALNDGSVAGPINATAPNPVTNHEFTKTLGKVLNRPTVIPMPAFAARMAFGEVADEILLSSARVAPKRMTDHGFEFLFPRLEPALMHLLGRSHEIRA
jgi:uncharacterized protein (TIGR01777 family)